MPDSGGFGACGILEWRPERGITMFCRDRLERHRQTMTITYAGFVRLVRPRVLELARSPRAA